ncbi:hypothetical protein MVEN_00914000 [Mycena venus]|uniref:Uncharacterized protein n=1 Tax=Mycena venus TaxID=2733690 RepID=A0A8H7CZ24_9AGAR|nr:hypothetical protein MVEN_00914000 [Mycena venus]
MVRAMSALILTPSLIFPQSSQEVLEAMVGRVADDVEEGVPGGTGEGPTLSYRVRAKSFTVKNTYVPQISSISSFTLSDDAPTQNQQQAKKHQSDFSDVKLGDLKLSHEIGKDTVVARWQVGRRRMRSSNAVVVTRRIYSAQVVGHQDPVTAVVSTKEG